jgi:predicted hotdog family 3-hydroxylacyl-ACP dehydratase
MSAGNVAALVPHSGAMCLLSEVVHHDHKNILCHATSHRSADNPLRCDGRLPALAGIEYAAQAVAAHCTLVDSAPGERVRRGLLAGARAVTLHAMRLDDIAAPLGVRARRLVADGPRYLYAFTLEAGQQRLLEGRIAVVVKEGGL